MIFGTDFKQLLKRLYRFTLFIMKIEPIDEIVPLKIDSPQVEENLHRLALLLEDVRNFGTVVIRAVFIDDKGINEYVRSVVTCFLRQIVEDVDAISILINNSASDPCFLNLRRLFENYIYLKYVLKERSEERAKAYYVNHLLSKRRHAEEGDYSTSIGKEHKTKIEKDDIAKFLELESQDCRSEVEKIDSILQKPECQSIKTAFDQRKKELKRARIHWYSLIDGPTSLDGLSNSVGCSGLYEVLYRYFSKFSHSENELENIDSEGAGQAGLVQIRNPEHAQLITQMALTYAFYSFQITVRTLRPQCRRCLYQFYKENIDSPLTELKEKEVISVIRK
jgi:hypothetical protein